MPIIRGVRAVGRGELFVAAGEVETIHWPRRDALLVPCPAIEIRCGSLGGMSGGAVIDEGGALVGILSRSFETADGLGPSTAAWILHALMFDVTLPWPPGVYRPNTPILHSQRTSSRSTDATRSASTGRWTSNTPPGSRHQSDPCLAVSPFGVARRCVLARGGHRPLQVPAVPGWLPRVARGTPARTSDLRLLNVRG
jgi:hypothetical protein